jgi:hypothetical protein
MKPTPKLKNGSEQQRLPKKDRRVIQSLHLREAPEGQKILACLLTTGGDRCRRSRAVGPRDRVATGRRHLILQHVRDFEVHNPLNGLPAAVY